MVWSTWTLWAGRVKAYHTGCGVLRTGQRSERNVGALTIRVGFLRVPY